MKIYGNNNSEDFIIFNFNLRASVLGGEYTLFTEPYDLEMSLKPERFPKIIFNETGIFA